MRHPKMLTSVPPITAQRRTRLGSIELTEGQLNVWRCIVQIYKTYGVPPARSDLKVALGVSSQTAVDGYLHRLAAKNWVRLVPGAFRGIAPCRMGVPIYSAEDFHNATARVTGRDGYAREPEWVDCEELWKVFGETPALCLRVRGTTMLGAELAQGDIVALRRWVEERGETPVKDGETAAVRIGTDVILGRWHNADDDRGAQRKKDRQNERRLRADRRRDRRGDRRNAPSGRLTRKGETAASHDGRNAPGGRRPNRRKTARPCGAENGPMGRPA